MEKHEEIRKKITEEVNLRVGGNKLSEGTRVLKVFVVDSQDNGGECSGSVTVWRPGHVWMEMNIRDDNGVDRSPSEQGGWSHGASHHGQAGPVV